MKKKLYKSQRKMLIKVTSQNIFANKLFRNVSDILYILLCSDIQVATLLLSHLFGTF